MSVTYTRQQRDRAKAERKRLVTMHVSGPGGKGGLTFAGTVDETTGAETAEFVRRWISANFGKAKATATEESNG